MSANQSWASGCAVGSKVIEMNLALLHKNKLMQFIIPMPNLIRLINLKPGVTAKVTAFGEMPASQQAALQAYGVLPGRNLLVLQQKPLTIVQVEWTELAFEAGVARQVIVQPAQLPGD
jgi:Fe2+ transport system protein FeoA